MNSHINDKECPLCKLCFKGLVITKRYYEDSNYIIVDCATCKTPMIVYKGHGTVDIPQHSQSSIYKTFQKYVKEIGRFPHEWTVDMVPHTIKDHWHAHARRRGVV